MSDFRYYIRMGRTRGRGRYVKTYAGGDVTMTTRRSNALWWRDHALVRRLAVAVGNARVVRHKIIKGPFARMSRRGLLLALKCRGCGVKMSGPCMVPRCKPCGGFDSLLLVQFIQRG